MQSKYRLIAITVTLLLLVSIVGWAAAQSNALAQPDAPAEPNAALGPGFTYQGTLVLDGQPVDGVCDFQFSLWDADTAGAQLGSTQEVLGLAVTGGSFTSTLNGANEFGDAFMGAARWLQVAVRCPAGSGSYTALTPRQVLSAAPYALGLMPGAMVSGASPSSILSVTNTQADAVALRGEANSNGAVGVYGSGGYYGVWGESTDSLGVYGFGGQYGVYGVGLTGVYGNGADYGVAGNGTIFGVQGITYNYNAIGVKGIADAAGSVGVWGESAANTGVYGVGGAHGVWGSTDSQSATAVYGEANATGSIGVWGHSDANTGVYGNSTNGVGVWGASAVTVGVFATSPNVGMNAQTTGVSSSRAAVVGDNFNSSTGWAGYFYGNVHATGTVSLAASGFTIDNPLDPANQTLSHSSVESPDMKNLYDGIIVTDDQGQAVVQLPDYFEALNQDFRYQLTVIGQFAQAIVAQEIANNQFTIQTDQPNVKVSWQVTGVRHDPYASWQPLVVESQKSADQVGLYLQPQAYGMPAEMGIGYQAAQPPAEMNIQSGELPPAPQAPQAGLPALSPEH